MQDADDLFQAVRGDGVGDLTQRQMSGGQRHAHAAAGQHHHHLGRVRALGQVFGVAGEGDAAVVDDSLVHRRGYHGGEFAGQAPSTARSSVAST